MIGGAVIGGERSRARRARSRRSRHRRAASSVTLGASRTGRARPGLRWIDVSALPSAHFSPGTRRMDGRSASSVGGEPPGTGSPVKYQMPVRPNRRHATFSTHCRRRSASEGRSYPRRTCRISSPTPRCACLALHLDRRQAGNGRVLLEPRERSLPSISIERRVPEVARDLLGDVVVRHPRRLTYGTIRRAVQRHESQAGGLTSEGQSR